MSIEQHRERQRAAENAAICPTFEFADFPPACRDRNEIGMRRDVDRPDDEGVVGQCP